MRRPPRQAVDVDDSAAQFERADGAVVLVLDPDFGAGSGADSSGQRICAVGASAA